MISSGKILHINLIANSLSTGRITEGIGLLANEYGFSSFIAYNRLNNSSSLSTIKIGNKFDSYLHALYTRLFDNHGLNSKIATRNFIKKVIKIKPNIIHLHNIHGYYLNYRILFKYLAETKIPVLWTLHDCWPFTGHCAYFEFVCCNKWKSHCENCPQKNSYPKSVLIDGSRRNFKIKKETFILPDNIHLIPVSNWLNNLLKHSFLNVYPSQVIKNGIDLETFRPKNSSFRNNFSIETKNIILGIASVWDERKGLKDFLKLSKLIDNNAIIILVGLSKNQMKKLPKNIIGIKRTENLEQLVEIYNAADVFFNPTYEDNYPTTNLEAIACGTPVITYNTGGSIESVNKSTGHIVNKGDLEDVVLKIVDLNERNKTEVSIQCREYALKYFDRKIAFKEYISIYQNLIANKTRYYPNN